MWVFSGAWFHATNADGLVATTDSRWIFLMLVIAVLYGVYHTLKEFIVDRAVRKDLDAALLEIDELQDVRRGLRHEIVDAEEDASY